MKVRRRAGQRGQSLVEFALIAPAFFIFLFGAMEASLFINAQATLDDATREGARVGAICGSYHGAQIYFGGNGYTSCALATISTVQGSMGILPVILPDTNPAVAICDQSTGCAGAYAGAPAGDTIQVTAVYHYTYYVAHVLGLQNPAVDLTSTVRVVSQQ